MQVIMLILISQNQTLYKKCFQLLFAKIDSLDIIISYEVEHFQMLTSCSAHFTPQHVHRAMRLEESEACIFVKTLTVDTLSKNNFSVQNHLLVFLPFGLQDCNVSCNTISNQLCVQCHMVILSNQCFNALTLSVASALFYLFYLFYFPAGRDASLQCGLGC